MLSCKDVAEMLAGSDFKALPWHRKIALRMHAKLCKCHFCHDYADKVVLFRSMCRKLAEEQEPVAEESSEQLSPEVRDRIASSLRDGG